ncbi:MAG: carboxylesterase family protein [Acidimicrobiales bacterium]
MTDPVVETAAGAVRGRLLPDGTRLFAGIPFAAPPIGDLRFRPPLPATPWSGVLDAGAAPAPPAQGVAALSGEGAGSTGSEDCLYLNVWVPPSAGPYPVLVWIYGGGFENGSASPPETNGAALARRLDAIVVATNYRVGALGWLHLADLGGSAWRRCTNLGLQDQAAALGWVRDHVAAFGGDAANITVAGESAGAFSIGSLLAVPGASASFDRAILQSGSTSRIFPADIATSMAADLLVALQLDEVDQLTSVPVEQLLVAQRSVIDSDIGRRNLPGGRSWGVVLDGDVLPIDPQAAVAAGAARHIDLLVGTNRDEVQLFEVLQGEAYVPADEAELLDEMVRGGVARPDALLEHYRRTTPSADLARLRSLFLADAIYRLPALRLAAAHVDAGGRSYSSLFSGEPLGPAYGACHAAELAYLFDRLDEVGADTLENAAVADEFATAWSRFVSTSDPGWPVYDPNAALNTRQFGGTDEMVPQPAPGLIEAWGESAGLPSD